MMVYEHKVQYYETDQMRVVHHSNYIRWFEECRIAMSGVIRFLPVSSNDTIRGSRKYNSPNREI